MAEERICVRRIPNPCNSCNIKPCTGKCIFGTLYEKDRYSMTRAEAIERITKAIAIKYFEGVFSCENEEIEEYAEAALNALLEGN